MERVLDGKVAIVTGVGRMNSIGTAYARGLAEAGASVVVADIQADGAKAVAGALSDHDHRVVATSVDVTDPASIRAMAGYAIDQLGGIDILVNNAALMVELSWAPVIDTPLDEWNRVLAVNTTGALVCAQAVVPSMRERGGGKIINQVSAGAFPPVSLYGITKLALVALTVTLAKELGPSNINVNAIAPGMVKSESGIKLTPEGAPITEMVEQTVAMRARGEPGELVPALLLLASAAGDWITGQTIHVDGGWVLRT